MLHIKANAYCPCIACSPQTTSIMAGLTEPWNIPGMIHVINEEEMWWKVMIKFTSRRLLSFLIDIEDKKGGNEGEIGLEITRRWLGTTRTDWTGKWRGPGESSRRP